MLRVICGSTNHTTDAAQAAPSKSILRRYRETTAEAKKTTNKVESLIFYHKAKLFGPKDNNEFDKKILELDKQIKNDLDTNIKKFFSDVSTIIEENYGIVAKPEENIITGLNNDIKSIIEAYNALELENKGKALLETIKSFSALNIDSHNITEIVQILKRISESSCYFDKEPKQFLLFQKIENLLNSPNANKEVNKNEKKIDPEIMKIIKESTFDDNYKCYIGFFV